MDNSEYLAKFMEIGLTEREAKVYITLLGGRVFTALELQEAVNIPRTKIYEVLHKLVNRNICIEKKLGRHKLYEAVEPKIAMERLLDHYNRDVERKRELVNHVVDVFTPIFENNKSIINPLDFIDVMKDKQRIHDCYTNCVRNTKKEMLTFNKGPYACDNDDRLGEQEAEEFKLLRRGGVCKDLYELDELRDVNWLLDSVQKSTELGQQARIVKSLPIKMLIFDEERVMFALQQPIAPTNELTMIYIEHHQLAKACSILFYHLWDQGRDLSHIINELTNSNNLIAV